MDNYIHNSSVTNNSTNDEKIVLTWSDITKTERTKLHNECRHTIMVRLKEGENSLNNKEVLVKDIVSYKPPFGFLGSIANMLIIKKKLNEIFDYRSKVLEQQFPL